MVQKLNKSTICVQISSFFIISDSNCHTAQLYTICYTKSVIKEFLHYLFTTTLWFISINIHLTIQYVAIKKYKSIFFLSVNFIFTSRQIYIYIYIYCICIYIYIYSPCVKPLQYNKYCYINTITSQFMSISDQLSTNQEIGQC